jgi:toxin ParE1/3/4
MTYSFHPEARAEYIAAIEFYESRGGGLGARLTIEMETGIERILEAPTRWGKLQDDVRRYLVHTFPYGILYTIEQDAILIVAVMHCSRRPGYWKHRMN